MLFYVIDTVLSILAGSAVTLYRYEKKIDKVQIKHEAEMNLNGSKSFTAGWDAGIQFKDEQAMIYTPEELEIIKRHNI